MSKRSGVALLQDRAEIYDLVMRYAKGVDTRDFDLVGSCFAPDVIVDGWGPHPFNGRTDLIDYIRGVAHFDMTMHMFGNQYIHLDGDSATVDSYAMLTHHRPDWILNVSNARYTEKLARTTDGWVIVHRGSDPVWMTDTAAR